MSADVHEYVKACVDCRRIKSRRHLLYRELQLLHIPKKSQQNWILNFIIDLSSSVRQRQVLDAVLVMMDRYTKFAKYITARKNREAENIIDVLVEEVFTKYDKPVFFVSNHGSLFTSKFYLSIWLGYSIAFHPQTNRQMKYQNQTLEQYLQDFVNYQQDNWVFWLSLTEYIYNNSVYSLTWISLFKALFGEKLSKCHTIWRQYKSCWKNTLQK